MLEKALRLKDEIIRLRRDIHQHPELSFQEVRTAQLVADTLEEIGYTNVKTQVGRTGVTAEIGTGDGPTIGIRADMDALPITEAVDVPWKSVNDGVMHACGHDAHTAILLGVAHLLYEDFAENQPEWNGNVRLLFQPSEEMGDDNGISGAMAMIDDNALAGVDHTIALHVGSSLESGKLYFRDGYSCAAQDAFEAWVRGDGGHGAYPHEGSDPLYILSVILPQLYAIPSRYINPKQPVVISIGEIRGGSAPNVIPGEVYIQGTVRSYDANIREQLLQEIKRSFSITENLGGSHELKFKRGYPALYNDNVVNNWMRDVTRSTLGSDAIVEDEGGMGAEDFAYMTQLAPGAMFMLGVSNGGGSHHTSIFDIDEDVLSHGAAVLAETARRFVTGKLTDRA